jgi:tetratricopeptide (TPR) repeat protein
VFVPPPPTRLGDREKVYSSRRRGAYDLTVHSGIHIDPDQFVASVTPLIERNDGGGLVALIQRRWTLPQVVRLLDQPHADGRKCASLVLSLIGTESCLEALCAQLRDADTIAAQMAEHAMWAIWLRSGNDRANVEIALGTQAFERKKLQEAIRHFSNAIDFDPGFAEAYNQRAMAYFVGERIEESLRDCRRAVELMPMHFGAWSGLGHCYACLGKLDRAVDCYLKAKQINPHLACVDDLIAELQGDGSMGG